MMRDTIGLARIMVRNMSAQIETQIRECEARLYAAMLASDVSELDTSDC